MITVGDQIISVVDALCEKFGIVIDWTSQNIMPMLQALAGKYIAWEITTSVIWAVLAIIGIIVASLCFRDKSFDEDTGWFVFGYILLAIWIPVVITQMFDIAKCICFPELQIIEYIKLLIKSSNG